ncbi:hypothetical protein [Vibrio cyclitrophicus]|uniref:hypothetical protein n=1 Tax=Vibrio cyclitrophicus TaxID=47951 RepID=UPI000C842716|nr:hypothetical protein [Vibrio cyclitrophicus]PME27786.1 hypothetical protein BCV41_02450 [Vibrio cyclitrophicus]PMF48319.1 hypothetical protein BCV14_00480 [Vibrio cyclitrophicus]PMF54055.1 hypothetical protein BCV12_02850 [Vibrio cyclitrophicus]PMH51699.1 hypothetical protein BCU67_11475 [Vibrio cyclitrophicus]PMK76353.1 hypothetical protein BCT91_08815 [Vibrio cyclitrophicus]
MYIKSMAILLLANLIGCTSNGESNNTDLDETNQESKGSVQLVGINIEKFGEKSTVKYTPPSGTYYGKLKVEPSVYKGAIKGEEAQGVKDYLFNIFGSEKNEFVITFNAKIQDVSLAPAILFAYKYDSKDKTWYSKVDEVYTSPIFNISSHDEIDYTLNIQSSSKKDVDLFSKIKSANDAMKTISSGSWVINQLAEPIVTIGALTVDQELSRAMTSNYESEINSKIFTLSKTSSGMNKYRLKNSKQDTLAEIIVSVEYYNSLVVGDAMSYQTLSKAESVIKPKLTSNVSPYPLSHITVKRYKEADRKLIEDINNSNPSIIANVRDANSKKQLYSSCSELITLLRTTYDLNRNDIDFVMHEVLSSSDYVTSKSSINVSRCFQDLKSLNNMGLKISNENVDINVSFLNELVGYLRTPISNSSSKRSLVNYFRGGVYFESHVDYLDEFNGTLLTRDELVDIVGRIGANRAGRFHMDDKRKLTVIYYNHHDDLNRFYKITLNNAGSLDNRIAAVKIEYATENELSNNDITALAKISGFESQSSVKPTNLAVVNTQSNTQ